MKPLEQFLLTREELAHKVSTLGNMLGRMGLSDRQIFLQELENECQDTQFRVMISGEFKRGKSCLVNALLGEKLLPMKVAPCTSTVTEVRYDDTPSLEVHTPLGIQQKDFEDRIVYCTIQGQQTLPEEEKPVHKVVIKYPSSLGNPAITLIDSPGLNEDWSRTQTSLREIAQSDALILVLSCEMALSQSEQQFIQSHLLPYTDRLFFLWNRADAIWDKPLEQAALERRSEQHLNHYSDRIFYVSAREGLIGRLSNDDARWNKSQIQDVLTAIENYVVKQKSNSKLQGLWLRSMQEITYTLQQLIPRTLALLSLPEEELLSRKEHLLNLSNEDSVFRSKIQEQLTQHTQLILDAIEKTVDEFVETIPSRIIEDSANLVFEPRLSRQEREDIIVDWFEQWLQSALHEFTQHTVRTKMERQMNALKQELDTIRQDHTHRILNIMQEDTQDVLLFSGKWIEEMSLFVATAASLLLLNINRDRVASDLLKVRALRGWLIGNSLSQSDREKLAYQLQKTIQNERKNILDTQREHLKLAIDQTEKSLQREFRLNRQDLNQQIERVLQLHGQEKQDMAIEQHKLDLESTRLSLEKMQDHLRTLFSNPS